LLESSFGCPGAWRPRRHGNLTGSGSSDGESGPQGVVGETRHDTAKGQASASL
jgi:hypothetical protein